MTTKVEMVSVVIPTLNEAGNILEAVNTIQQELAYPKEIIVVDGNSTDGTIQLVKHINRLLDEMIKNDAEMCLATRMYDPKKAMGLTNFIGNKVITWCFDFFYKQFLSDSQSGFRAISHASLEKVELKEDDMAFATEMLVEFAKKGFKMVEFH